MKPPAVKFMLIRKDDGKERTGSPGDPLIYTDELKGTEGKESRRREVNQNSEEERSGGK
jgi:hypothetical protein